ncbi:hypothetical protein [Hymenobacter guriensis]|uniref:Lipoprotein n=1 Tax=Hymenobacter guriensis TaxID=2793065 RepID=A0ABS0L0F3_9BACT|nr:hypothetical protein [Hymenobacter guriensis]MBG8553594.1 hypothetical protein [Hymenobacter guriensis]
MGFFLPLVCLGLSNCIGFTLVTDTRQLPVSRSRATIGSRIGKDGGRAGGVTTADALRLWGKPIRRDTLGAEQRWVYRSRQVSWRGIEIYAILPLPLLVPTGFKKVTLTFDHDQLRHYTIDNGRQRFFGYFIWGFSNDKQWQFNQEQGDPMACNGYLDFYCY